MQKKLLPSLIVIVLILCNHNSFAEPAPGWTLQDADGNNVSLADFYGKPLILHFWATWCPYCKKVQPGLDHLYMEYRDQGLQLIAISFREDEAAEPQKSLDSRNQHFKTLLNGGEVAKNYGVKGTPTTFFIDAEGEIVLSTRTSNPDDPQLEIAVKDLLDE